MFDEPGDLPRHALVASLADGWNIVPTTLTYQPVGFGSHHWLATAADRRWFVTVDDLAAKRRDAEEPFDTADARLRAALSAARTARDRGLEFVVAPIVGVNGDVVRRVGDRFSVAVYPFVDGVTRGWADFGSIDERLAVVDLIVDLHELGDVGAVTDDLAIPRRADLCAALDELTSTWDTGPFGERARRALATNAAGVERRLSRYDRLAADVAQRPERMVTTHGEPHVGNTIVGADGWSLVDWDTTLVAPPERDLWMLAGSEGAVLDAYTARTGRAVIDDALDCYRLWFDLAEIAGYVAHFREAHDDGADVRESWTNLRHFLGSVSAAQI